MLANLTDPRVGSIAAGHVAGLVLDSPALDNSPEFREFEVRLGPGRPSNAVYVRRRLLVGLLLVALCVAVGVTVRSVLADRGGVPASTPAIQPAALATAPSVAVGQVESEHRPTAAVPTSPSYIVQPGDTLWSIAGRLRGESSMSDYVDKLVSSNGGASVQAGQLLTLP